MGFDFFNIFKNKPRTDRSTPVGVIVVRHTPDVANRKNLVPRVGVIAEQLRSAGVTDIVCTMVAGPGFPPVSVADVKLLDSKNIQAYVHGRHAVFVGEDQYHIAHEWVVDLMQRARETGIVHFPEGYRDNPPNQIAHQRLRGVFVAAPPNLAGEVGEFVANGMLHSWYPELSFKDVSIPSTLVDVTSANMGSIYRQCVKYDRPINFIVELNSTCNYVCLMCPYHGGRQKRGPYYLGPKKATEMPIERFKELIDEIKALDRPYEDEDLSVRITPYRRGELLYHPHWREALAHVKENGFDLYFSTNGSLWTDDDIKYVVDIGVDLIQVSINGYGVETHKRLRLNEEYEQVAGVAKGIIRERMERGLDKPRVQANNILNEHTVKEMPTYLDYWLPRVDQIFLSPESYTDDEGKKVYKTEFSNFSEPDHSLRPTCAMVKDYFILDADGQAILCMGAKSVKTGSHHQMTVQELLDSPVRQQIFRKHAEGDYDNPTCKTCGHWLSQTYYEREDHPDYVSHKGPSFMTYSRNSPPMVSETVELAPNDRRKSG